MAIAEDYQIPAESVSLGEHLIREGLISRQMYDVSVSEQRVTKEKLGKILVQNGFIPQRVLVDAIHAVDMSQMSSEQAVVTKAPATLLIDTQTMILAESRTHIYIATASEEDLIASLLRQYYPVEELVFRPVDLSLLDEYLDKLEKIVNNEGSEIDRILREALRLGVSDVHILPRRGTYSVQFRYLGVLQHQPQYEGTIDDYQLLITQVKDRCGIDISERRIPHDGGFQIEFNGRMIDMRVATFPVVDGEKIVIRLLDPDSVNPDLNKLGITYLDKWKAGISSADGLALVCGPTGSGKTTTMNGTLRVLDRFGKSINTLEDPVEYRIPFVSQVNINKGVGLDFAKGLRAFMRGDPDIIICGEIRDKETAEVAISASETGHMVLGTLHTRSIRDSMTRLRDIGVGVSDLRYILRSVLVQRLMRTYCPVCGGKGCDSCFHTGYGGRTVISECEYFDSPDQIDRMMDGEVWWKTMEQDALLKYEQGITSQEEVIRIFGEQGRKVLRDGGHKLEAGLDG